MRLKDVSHDWKPKIQIQKLFISAKLQCFCILLRAFFQRFTILNINAVCKYYYTANDFGFCPVAEPEREIQTAEYSWNCKTVLLLFLIEI